VNTSRAAQIKACQGIYRAVDVANYFNVNASTVTRIWKGQRHADLSPAVDYPDFYSRPTPNGLAEEVAERTKRGDSVQDIADALNISTRWVYQLRGIFQ
jgi:transcriptional regulator with XRE-family HTH domain